MKKKTRYETNPFGNITLGKDVYFGRLPTPEELAAKELTTKITLSLTTDSLERLKASASRVGIPYQVMIRRLIDAYVIQVPGNIS